MGTWNIRSVYRAGSLGIWNVRSVYRAGSLGIWNVRSVYRAGSIAAAAIELDRNKLELKGVQEFG